MESLSHINSSEVSNYIKSDSLNSDRIGSHKLLELEVKIAGCIINYLIDSGSKQNFVSKKIPEELGLYLTWGDTLQIIPVDGSKITVDMIYHLSIYLN